LVGRQVVVQAATGKQRGGAPPPSGLVSGSCNVLAHPRATVGFGPPRGGNITLCLAEEEQEPLPRDARCAPGTGPPVSKCAARAETPSEVSTFIGGVEATAPDPPLTKGKTS
jgi:hypothetical protein